MVDGLLDLFVLLVAIGGAFLAGATWRDRWWLGTVGPLMQRLKEKSMAEEERAQNPDLEKLLENLLAPEQIAEIPNYLYALAALRLQLVLLLKEAEAISPELLRDRKVGYVNLTLPIGVGKAYRIALNNVLYVLARLGFDVQEPNIPASLNISLREVDPDIEAPPRERMS